MMHSNNRHVLFQFVCPARHYRKKYVEPLFTYP